MKTILYERVSFIAIATKSFGYQGVKIFLLVEKVFARKNLNREIGMTFRQGKFCARLSRFAKLIKSFSGTKLFWRIFLAALPLNLNS
jgi:hypothetical protein